ARHAPARGRAVAVRSQYTAATGPRRARARPRPLSVDHRGAYFVARRAVVARAAAPGGAILAGDLRAAPARAHLGDGNARPALDDAYHRRSRCSAREKRSVPLPQPPQLLGGGR